MNFTTGDAIAIVVGGVGILRWLLAVMGKKEDIYLSHDHDLGEEQNKLRREFIKHAAEDNIELRWIKEALLRLERKVDNLQSQMRNVATNTNDTLYRSKDMKDE